MEARLLFMAFYMLRGESGSGKHGLLQNIFRFYVALQDGAF
jgi:hypothetical protein